MGDSEPIPETEVEPVLATGSPAVPSEATESSEGDPALEPTSGARVTLVSSATGGSSSSPCPHPCPEDVVDGLRFLHLLGTQSQARIAELSASLYALIELLIADGQLPIAAYEQRRQRTVSRENERTAREASVQVSEVPDKYALADLPQIDCAALLPLCGARCCRLSFPLSVQDLDERIVRWMYGKPYLNAQRPDGMCVHCERGRCTVYTYRPAACRSFDCRADPRIWSDFDKRIPATTPG